MLGALLAPSTHGALDGREVLREQPATGAIHLAHGDVERQCLYSGNVGSATLNRDTIWPWCEASLAA